MLEAATGAVSPPINLSNVVLAIGGLGTAAYGVVDACKGFGGGISNRGYFDIKKVMAQFIPPSASAHAQDAALSFESIMRTLRANWLNGMALADQKAVAKALIKLSLNEDTAERMARATGLDQDTLQKIAEKLSGKLDTSTGKPPLTPAETDLYGRFDLLLSAMLDQAYERADQRYRNSAKLLAVVVAVALALLGAKTIYGHLGCGVWERALIGGLLATPLAPIAKDLASAIQEGAKLAQAWKK
ncbi:MAG TPA: hypothetical protein VGS27_12505 [Candidatus Sulfotelmatobacter sp.]|nr:hypothetical protein [Candidatus Sulfotelmatobacter sp.]